MKIKTLLLSVLLAISQLGFSQVKPERGMYPKHEFRGAWLHTVSDPFKNMSTDEIKKSLINQLDALAEAGINAVVFQIRPEADALYMSELEPWSRYLTGEQGKAPSPMWDPMQFMIEECNNRGMEFHAWINPYRVKKTLKNELAKNHLYNRKPNLFVEYGDQLFFNPARQENIDHICNVVKDIVSRYDVDAIHMDDYFYPYPLKGIEYPDYEEYTYTGSDRFDNIGDWRRDNVNRLIEKMSKVIKETKPWVKFGISPFGIYRNKRSYPLGSNTNGLQNYDDLYADILLWIDKGWIDYNVPQIYWQVGHKVADYEELIKWWNKYAGKRHIYIGQAVENTVKNTDPNNNKINQLPIKMRLQRSLENVKGSCQWPAVDVVNNKGKYKDALQKVYHKYPAIVPAMNYIDDKAPKPVVSLKKKVINNEIVLFWKAPKAANEMDRARRYVIYKFSKAESIDLDRSDRIVSITTNTAFIVGKNNDSNRNSVYVVTALDRLSNESKGKKIKM